MLFGLIVVVDHCMGMGNRDVIEVFSKVCDFQIEIFDKVSPSTKDHVALVSFVRAFFAKRLKTFRFLCNTVEASFY